MTWLQPANGADGRKGNKWRLEMKIMGPGDELTVAEALHIASRF